MHLLLLHSGGSRSVKGVSVLQLLLLLLLQRSRGKLQLLLLLLLRSGGDLQLLLLLLRLLLHLRLLWLRLLPPQGAEEVHVLEVEDHRAHQCTQCTSRRAKRRGGRGAQGAVAPGVRRSGGRSRGCPSDYGGERPHHVADPLYLASRQLHLSRTA